MTKPRAVYAPIVTQPRAAAADAVAGHIEAMMKSEAQQKAAGGVVRDMHDLFTSDRTAC